MTSEIFIVMEEFIRIIMDYQLKKLIHYAPKLLVMIDLYYYLLIKIVLMMKNLIVIIVKIFSILDVLQIQLIVNMILQFASIYMVVK